MNSVYGKVVLITGGAGGIGLSLVKTFLENGAKWINTQYSYSMDDTTDLGKRFRDLEAAKSFFKGVAIVDINEEVGNKAAISFKQTFGENKVIFVKTDITNKDQIQGAFEITVKTFSQLDIVVNNAGYLNEVEWEKTIAVNLSAVIESTYLALQKYLPKYKSGEEGVIINTSSVLGFYKHRSYPVYVSTKHALIGFAKVLGDEEFYKKYKVRVLTICPGLVSTPMADVLDKPENVWFPETLKQEVLALNPIAQPAQRVGEAMLEIIKKGKTGSLWVIEDDEPLYEVEVPLYRTMKVSKT